MNHKTINIKFRICLCILCLAVIFGYSACSSNKEEDLLDPEHPISITLWHSFNGITKELFDHSVEEFNDSVGIEKGVIVNALSQGEEAQLANAIYDSAINKLGARTIPHLFTSYSDNALRIEEEIGLVDFEQYFSEKELAQFDQRFLKECRIGENNKLALLPFTKSPEALFLNKTYWDEFSAKTGVTKEALSSWEGIRRTAETYYNWTDAKTPEIGDGSALLGIDSASNFFTIMAKQLGIELYTEKNGKMSFKFRESFARTIWENYYIPYLNGYYGKFNRFCSDDAKTGLNIAYVDGTARAGYFPEEVTHSITDVYSVECEVLPYPVIENGTPYTMLRGENICITKSDKAHEYASSLFVKWFTEGERNTVFSSATGCLPVRPEIESDQLSEKTVHHESSAKKTTVSCAIDTAMGMLDNDWIYSEKTFKNSYEIKEFLNINIFGQVEKDLDEIENLVAEGIEREEAVNRHLTEVSFQEWYQTIFIGADAVLNGGAAESY